MMRVDKVARRSAIHGALTFLLAAGCNGAGGGAGSDGTRDGTGDGTSGIRGTVTRGPIQPVQREGQPNSEPLPNAPIVVYPCEQTTGTTGGPEYCTKIGPVVARAKSDAGGKFTIKL